MKKIKQFSFKITLVVFAIALSSAKLLNYEFYELEQTIDKIVAEDIINF